MFRFRHAELRQQQTGERLGIEEAHLREISEFQENWDRMIKEFESHATNLVEELEGNLQSYWTSEFPIFQHGKLRTSSLIRTTLRRPLSPGSPGGARIS